MSWISSQVCVMSYITESILSPYHLPFSLSHTIKCMINSSVLAVKSSSVPAISVYRTVPAPPIYTLTDMFSYKCPCTRERQLQTQGILWDFFFYLPVTRHCWWQIIWKPKRSERASFFLVSPWLTFTFMVRYWTLQTFKAFHTSFSHSSGMKQTFHNGGWQICGCLCVGDEVTGETCRTAVLGFYNESNVMGPYDHTSLFLQKDLGRQRRLYIHFIQAVISVECEPKPTAALFLCFLNNCCSFI